MVRHPLAPGFLGRGKDQTPVHGAARWYRQAGNPVPEPEHLLDLRVSARRSKTCQLFSVDCISLPIDDKYSYSRDFAAGGSLIAGAVGSGQRRAADVG